MKEDPQKILLITHDAIGKDETLGQKLLQGFLSAFCTAKSRPAKIVFVNRGVYLTAGPGNEALLQSLLELQKMGVQIKSCGTCLDYFGLRESLKVGEVGSAVDTVESLMELEVVTL